jgi:hypothetical protein
MERRFMNAKLILFASLILTTAAETALADITRTTYEINPGGQYTYKPSPFGSGIPGGIPSAYELGFGIGGTFVYELDNSGPTARLLDLDLMLTGNEAIQAAPPAFDAVTADRVEEFLASQTFVEDFVGGLLHLESSTYPELKLTDGLNGSLSISGGFDSTPVDGNGMLFDFSAVAVPEPTGFTLVATAMFALCARRSCRFRIGTAASRRPAALAVPIVRASCRRAGRFRQS